MDIEFTEFGIMDCFVNSLVIWCVLIDDVGVGDFNEKQQNQVWPNLFVMNNFYQSFNAVIFFLE